MGNRSGIIGTDDIKIFNYGKNGNPGYQGGKQE
jgi:hypothetical protein